jgi:hypothetical protein
MPTADEWILIKKKNKRGMEKKAQEDKARKHMSLIRDLSVEIPGAILTTVCLSKFKCYNDYDNIEHWLKMNGNSMSELPHGLQSAGVPLSEWQQLIRDIDAAGYAINPYLTCFLSMPPLWPFGCLFCCLTDCLNQREKKLLLLKNQYSQWKSKYGVSVDLNGSNSEVHQWGNKSVPMPGRPKGGPKHYFGIQLMNQNIIEELRVLAYSDEEDQADELMKS